MRTPGRLLSSLLACVVVAAGACSSDDTTSTSDTTTTTAAGAATASTTTTAASPTTTAPAGPLARYAGYQSVSYADNAHWLCRPGRDDICSKNLDSTTVAADGTLTIVPYEDPKDTPPVDCFYVYPTISRDPTPNSDWNASDQEEGYAAFNQVARLRKDCRVFAPIYRQRTLASLATSIGRSGGLGGSDAVDPYADVLDAWKTYMSTENQGRGVVLVGHSQGSALLSQLIKNEIDPNADVRAQLVAAYLAGWAVAVPSGKDVGGDFANVPVCRKDAEPGCVVTWASFRSTATPPTDSYFGKSRATGDPAACANPASLAGGSAEPTSEFPANRSASILASLSPDAPDATPWVDGGKGKITTPFVSIPGLVSTECVTKDGFGFLQVTVHGDPADPRADDIGGDLTPEWGLHLVDVNLVMGNMEDLVPQQAAAWAKAR